MDMNNLQSMNGQALAVTATSKLCSSEFCLGKAQFLLLILSSVLTHKLYHSSLIFRN